MTYKEILNKFKENTNIKEIDDYRPFCKLFVNFNEIGIVVWLNNGDKLVYIPKNKGY